jgi:DMSO/TMAO reductase YedYZ heme-binding membrane subunit
VTVPPKPDAGPRGILARRGDLSRLDAVHALLAVSVLAVTWMWACGTSVPAVIQSFEGLANGLGRVTGLLAAALLLVQVLLMARIPLLERGSDPRRLTRRHQMVGRWSISLLGAHLVLTVVGHSLVAEVSPVRQAWSMVTDYPGMLPAVAGTLALLMVAGTSVRAARRRLRYESWHLLHLYAYVGIALGIPHQLWTGADFTASPGTRAIWWAVYLTVLSLLLVYRVALPRVRSLGNRASVDRRRTVRNTAAAAVTAGATGLIFLSPAARGAAVGQHMATRPVGVEPAAAATEPAHHLHDEDMNAPPPPDPPGPGETVVNGEAISTPFGPVQVQIRLLDGRIVAAHAIVFPREGLADKTVNYYAVPLLQEATIAAQSAEIDTVSGATETSDGYRHSLQAALDAAHL